MFTFLTGIPPFHGLTFQNTLKKVVQGEYTMPENISNEAKDLIKHLLQKVPSDRIPLNSKCIMKLSYYEFFLNGLLFILEVLEHPFIKSKNDEPFYIFFSPQTKLSSCSPTNQIQGHANTPGTSSTTSSSSLKANSFQTTPPNWTQNYYSQQKNQTIDSESSSKSSEIAKNNQINKTPIFSGNIPPPQSHALVRHGTNYNNNGLTTSAIVNCSKHVNNVCARTHKITYYTDEAKCVLMEVNSYFEVYFNNGLNIHLLEEFIRIFDDRLKIDIKVLSKFASAVLAPHYQKALETVNKVRNLYLKIILF